MATVTGDVQRSIAIAAVAVLLLTLAATWQIAAIREAQATAAERSALIDEQVDVRQAPSDYDGDGVPDDRDECPTRPETVNEFRDGDGCPDVVSTTGAS